MPQNATACKQKRTAAAGLSLIHILTAEIISVGTELLLGNILNTNAQYLSRELAELGITVQRERCV